LARQGHNIDVSDAGTLADTTLTLYIEKFPESVSCHTAATLPQGQDHTLFEKLRAQLISKGIETVPK